MDKFLLIKTVPDLYIEPPLEFELTDDEFNSWCEAHDFYGAVANSCVHKILMQMYPTESFAEASARLGYADANSKKNRDWYYNHHIAIIGDGDYEVI